MADAMTQSGAGATVWSARQTSSSGVKLFLPSLSFFLRRQASPSFTVKLLPPPSPSSDVDAFLHLGLLLRLCASPPPVVLFKSLEPVFQILQIYTIKLVSSGKRKEKKNHDNRFTLGFCQIKGLERRERRKTQRRRRIERRERGRKVKDLVRWFCSI